MWVREEDAHFFHHVLDNDGVHGKDDGCQEDQDGSYCSGHNQQQATHSNC